MTSHSAAARENMRRAALARHVPAIDRFYSQIEYEAMTGCWLWSGYSSTRGYGFIKDRGRAQLTHRFAFRLLKGEIPASVFVCHRCDTPACCNPDHLFLGSPLDNVRDMMAKGRKPSRAGTTNHFAKITEEVAAEIGRRLSAGEPPCTIADALCVSRITVSQINCGKSWRHITGFERAAPVRSRPDRRSKTPLRSRGFDKSRTFGGGE